MKYDKLTRSVLTALFAAMVCVSTLAVHIPIPATQGYVNLGDAAVLLGAMLLGPAWGAAAGAIGSALADLVLGYTVYIPGTALIKGLCAAIAGLLFRRLYGKLKAAAVPACLAAELWMVAGYFLYECFALGYGAAAIAGAPANAMQATAGVIAGSVLLHALERVPAVKKLLPHRERKQTRKEGNEDV